MNTVWEAHQPFVHEAAANRVVFGMSSARTDLFSELVRLAAGRVLGIGVNKLSTIVEGLNVVWHGRLAGLFGPIDGRPWEDNIAAGLSYAREVNVDCIVAWGGGRVLSMARVIGTRINVPVICLPTTYAGSELRRLNEAHGLPAAVIYDPQLTITLDEATTVTTAMFALGRGIQACVSRFASPVSLLVALEGIRALADGLPDAVLDPDGLSGRSRTLYGSYMAGSAHTFVGPGLLDQLSTVLTQDFGLPYVQSQIVLLPHIASLQSHFTPQITARIADALSVDDAATGLFKFSKEVGAPMSLSRAGLSKRDLNAAADACWAKAVADAPEGMHRDTLYQLLEAAWQGRLSDLPYGAESPAYFNNAD